MLLVIVRGSNMLWLELTDQRIRATVKTKPKEKYFLNINLSFVNVITSNLFSYTLYRNTQVGILFISRQIANKVGRHFKKLVFNENFAIINNSVTCIYLYFIDRHVVYIPCICNIKLNMFISIIFKIVNVVPNIL